MPFFDGRRGRIFHHAWLPEADPVGAVLLLHGFGEHLGLYDALAQRLNAEGLAVHALDFAGHGRSDGERVVIDSWDEYVADALHLAALVEQQHPDVPVAVIGHSGGAAAAALLALRSPETAQAFVLSGAPLRPLDWVLDELALNRPEGEGGDPTEALSTHPDYVHALLHDPLTWKGGFKREYLAALAETWPEFAAGIAEGRPDVPVLFVSGEEDPLVPVSDVREVAGRLPRAEVVTFPGDLHDVLNEHDRDQVHDAVAGFVVEALALRWRAVPQTA